MIYYSIFFKIILYFYKYSLVFHTFPYIFTHFYFDNFCPTPNNSFNNLFIVGLMIPNPMNSVNTEFLPFSFFLSIFLHLTFLILLYSFTLWNTYLILYFVGYNSLYGYIFFNNGGAYFLAKGIKL